MSQAEAVEPPTIDRKAVFELAARLVESGWCQNQSALDSAGEPVRWESDVACSFCAGGAIARALKVLTDYWTPFAHSQSITWAQDALKAAGVTTGLPKWNDAPGRTKDEVAAMLRRAGEN
jgi:hypothetical protein